MTPRSSGPAATSACTLYPAGRVYTLVPYSRIPCTLYPAARVPCAQRRVCPVPSGACTLYPAARVPCTLYPVPSGVCTLYPVYACVENRYTGLYTQIPNGATPSPYTQRATLSLSARSRHSKVAPHSLTER